jgi:hypothetical protein
MISVKILVHASMTAFNLSIACCAAKRSASMFTSRRDALVLCEPAERVKKVMEHLLYDTRLDSSSMERYVSDS